MVGKKQISNPGPESRNLGDIWQVYVSPADMVRFGTWSWKNQASKWQVPSGHICNADAFETRHPWVAAVISRASESHISELDRSLRSICNLSVSTWKAFSSAGLQQNLPRMLKKQEKNLHDLPSDNSMQMFCRGKRAVRWERCGLSSGFSPCCGNKALFQDPTL